MDPQAILELMVSEIIRGDEDGAQESFAILIGWLRRDGFMPDMRKAVRKMVLEELDLIGD